MGICQESGVKIPDTVIDRTHRIGVPYVDKTTKKSCMNVIVWFSTFRHRIIVYQAKKNMKCPVRVNIGLTQKRHNSLVCENKYVGNIDSVKFC